ncbi:hypothetical protein [Flavobacterium sp.]|uniref:hypothetical protein n=1 Tax=Flavobacterium sp. TaxID=239 RepID=UPI0026202A28|nr:hypothetical protein [Flavobacterium sp.]
MNLSKIRILLYIALPIMFLSCNEQSEREKMEEREEAKVGEVYNRKVQGIHIENRDNQFYVSRKDDIEGTGLETGAPSDTSSIPGVN